MMLTDADKKFCVSIGRHVRQSLMAWWAEGCGTTSEHEFRAGEVLTPDSQADRDDFDRHYSSMGCQCCISPPCNYCTHPGNPENQEENDGCWVPAIAVWRHRKGGDLTDQELLRLAAMAVGHELRWSHEWPGGGCFMRRVVPEPEYPGSKWVPWRPLNDDGDALPLAVMLGLIVYHSVGDGTWKVSVIHQSEKRIISVREPWGNDRFAATRRAIVRIAAAIGRHMEGEAT